MIFYVRNCRKKARWKKRTYPAALTRVIILILALAAAVGLLFLCPRWLLIIFIIILGVAVCALLLR